MVIIFPRKRNHYYSISRSFTTSGDHKNRDVRRELLKNEMVSNNNRNRRTNDEIEENEKRLKRSVCNKFNAAGVVVTIERDL